MRQTAYTIRETAKLLGIGERKLFAVLRQQKIIDQSNLPYQRHITAGRMRVKHSTYIPPGTDITRHYGQTLVTDRGLEWLQRQIKENNNDHAYTH